MHDRVAEWLLARSWDGLDVDSVESMVDEWAGDAVEHGEGRVRVTAEAGCRAPDNLVLRIAVAVESRDVGRRGASGRMAEWTAEVIDAWNEERQGHLERGRATQILRELLATHNLVWGYALDAGGKTVLVKLFENGVPERLPTPPVERGVSLLWSGLERAHAVRAIRDLALRHGWSQEHAQRGSADAVDVISAMTLAHAVDAEHLARIAVEVLDGESGP